MKAVHIDRQILYQQVWKTPLVHLAKEYGISDVALGKICRKLRIPRPGVGHWAKVQHGRNPRRRNLPPWPEEQLTYMYVQPQRRADAEFEPISDIPDIPVPPDLARLHPLVGAAWKSLRRGRSDEYGILQPRKRHCLDLRVSRKELERGLRVLDGVAKGVKILGWKFELWQGARRYDQGDEPPWKTSIQIRGERLEVVVREKLRRKSRDGRGGQSAERRWPRDSGYDLVPAGQLELRIPTLEHLGVQCIWRDTKTLRLEDRLRSVFIGLDKGAQLLQRRREERERQELEWEEAKRGRERREVSLRYERALIDDLERMAADWATACQIGSFLSAAAAAMPSSARTPEAALWLAWATDYVSKLDPLGDPDTVPKEVDVDRLPV